MTAKFAVPYNGMIDPKEYVKRLAPYIDSIDSVYFSMPSMLPSFQDLPYLEISDATGTQVDVLKDGVDRNCRTLTELLKPLPVKSVLALNCVGYDMNPYERKLFLENYVMPMADDDLLDAVILCDFGMALDFHAYLPKIEIQVSCNANPITQRRMDLWNEKTGATVFNPPREAIRDRSMLEMFRKSGYVTKVIVNDYCLYGCPQYITHSVYRSFYSMRNGFPTICCFMDHYNVFRQNFLAPHHLYYAEPYVDVFKIVGRQDGIDAVFRRIDAYVNRKNDVNLLDLLPGYVTYEIRSKYGNDIVIPTSRIPEKMMYCKCDCKKYCKDGNDCRDLFIDVLKGQNLSYRDNPFLSGRRR